MAITFASWENTYLVTQLFVLALALVALALMFYAVSFVKMGEIEERRHIKEPAPQLRN